MRVKRFPRNPYIRALLPALRTQENARRELRWLENELPPHRELLSACKLRGRGYPLQYLLGTQPFGPLNIECARKVLIPRWETEEWVQHLANELHPSTRVLDLCTGTGCVLFLLAHEASVKGVGVDISPHARRIFLRNRAKLGMEHTHFLLGDLFEPLPGIKADIVVANPPYVHKLSDVDASVLWEPRLALLDSRPGLWDALVDRVRESGASRAVFEIGSWDQATHCQTIFERHGWDVDIRNDSAGHVRTIWATSPSYGITHARQ